MDDWFGMDPPKKPPPPVIEPEEPEKKVQKLASPEDGRDPRKRTSTTEARRTSRRSLRIDLVPDDGGPSDSTGLNIPT